MARRDLNYQVRQHGSRWHQSRRGRPRPEMMFLGDAHGRRNSITLEHHCDRAGLAGLPPVRHRAVCRSWICSEPAMRRRRSCRSGRAEEEFVGVDIRDCIDQGPSGLGRSTELHTDHSIYFSRWSYWIPCSRQFIIVEGFWFHRTLLLPFGSIMGRPLRRQIVWLSGIRHRPNLAGGKGCGSL